MVTITYQDRGKFIFHYNFLWSTNQFNNLQFYSKKIIISKAIYISYRTKLANKRAKYVPILL